MSSPLSPDPSRMDPGMPVRDHGSYASFHAPSIADIQDHRKQDTVYIGLHLPRQERRHRHRRHKHRKDNNDSSRTQNNQQQFSEAAPPSQRVQFLLGEEEDEDHRTHDIFCEMAELFPSGDEMEWKETARWIKFEEDVEEGGERWSKPHVATLSLHSLFELRCSLLQGTCMLELEANSMEQIADLILDNMIAAKLLEEHLRDQVRNTILCRHKHLNEKRRKEDGGSRMHLPFVRSLADIGKKYSEPKTLLSLGNKNVQSMGVNSLHVTSDDLSPAAKSTPNMQGLNPGISRTDDEKLEKGLTVNNSFSTALPSTGELSETASHKDRSFPKIPSMRNLHFMKKIPAGAEAANIFVGEVDYLNHQIVAFVRLTRAQVLGDLTEVPVPTRFVFLLLGPVGNQNKFHEIGRSIATLMSDEIFHDVAYHAHNREDLLAGIDEFLDQVTVLPPGEWDPSIRIEPPKSVPSQEGRKTASSGPPQPNGKALFDDEVDDHHDPTLVRTGRLFGGLINDVKRKLPWYLSDFKDALHVQCVASFVFLYFACLTPIITFGGLLGDATDMNMAALESILSGAICGILYSLFAGQPLTIIGSTGPVLVFETILNHFCKDNGLNYLEMRLWIGIWTGVILYVMVAFDLSALVRFITRFTEESFAALISLIFIVESLQKLIKIASDDPPNLHPNAILDYNCTCLVTVNSTFNNSTLNVTMAALNETLNSTFYNVTEFYASTKASRQLCKLQAGTLVGPGCDTKFYVPDVFFFSCLLFIGTFTLALSLKMSRNASFFPTFVRGIMSDFAVLIAILSMVLLDFFMGINTPKLHVPEKFAPTNPDREWFISPFGHNPWWTCIACLIPALLATILIFMDQQITAVIINRKENKLQKGGGYHLDLFVIATLIIICSFLGLPWFVAATVLSINHVNSLKKESQCSAPGESAKFLGVREQRVTGTLIFLFIGISVFLTTVLKFIPMPVLFGVFLYMGVSSLRGMQFVDRIIIMLMPPKYQPDLMYLRHVRTNRVHIFTAIQVVCLSILWVIKSVKAISIAFPVMVLAMCFVRKGMDKIFTQQELKWLDDIMPETHRREKEDQEMKLEEQRRSLIEDSTAIPMAALGFGSISGENWTVKADVDMLNISEEMSKTAMWKSIMSNESSTNLANQPGEEEGGHRSSSKKKQKKHSSKRNGSKPQLGGVKEESEEHGVPASPLSTSPSKKKTPVKFYIEEHDDHEEKDALIKPPEIVVDPPSDVHARTPDRDSLGDRRC
ncbi:sodium bicarbonate cotransporter 3-like isoform X2 [Physella acuta]|uniref:sodium bicarbonate cotransporter 3-like isoform X2 n=1 Tax=Physella acuta TaxID=109671 RepID=UPI0027DB30A5|nr:sodium bicarbonate cotransporter 3-like isoform X2 [Physella acuta]